MTSSIGAAEYYAGKSVFITGATGFMGLALVEKLLRSCPDVKTLYLLIRPKKGLGVEERLQEYVNNVVFNKVQAVYPKSLHKLRLVSGDVVRQDMGISILDQEELQRECHIIFHCAASVRFDMFIRDAVEINVCGTERLLKFAETMKNLEVFVHVSTAYCHDYLDQLEEKMYRSKHKPHDIMNMVSWMDDNMLKSIEEQLIHPLPNTYVYTKELSEDLVAQYAGRFTIAVARPSIVVAAHQEPIPGWINNLNGPTGLLVAAGKGVFRIMYTRKALKPDIIPVDVVVNATILLAYTTGVEQSNDIRVCNITNSGLNTMSWVDTSVMFSENIKKYPFSVCLWYPSLSYTEKKWLYHILALLLHWLPALLLDLLLTLFRKKRFMIKVQKRLHHGLELLEHYMTGDWIFKNDYFLSLRNRVSRKEKEIFFTEYETIETNQFSCNYVQGARQYCCKDPPSTIPKAKQLMTFLYIMRAIFIIIFLWWTLNLAYYVGVKFF